MHGRGGEEERNRWRHMWPASAPATAAEGTTRSSPPPVEAATTSNRSLLDSFLKDGRKIHVGDCALFRSDNSPPFIGIIRWFRTGEGENLKLGVNWLYRPSDINLAKGTSFKAAPNEVFYSFHRDEISAELLLHPCKVAFLYKGIELPSGVSSFVCRRVYDTTNKCLWWLTDRVCLNEQQEEVDQLLDKTRQEMRTVVQSGGRSPKSLNGASPTQLLKSGSGSEQNNSSSTTQSKGKKRGDKGDLGSESNRQECSSKADDRDYGNFIVDSTIKGEIAKITDNGGLINNDTVEKLVQLMQLDRGERKIDLAGRMLLADVITATERDDCLSRFVQLRGICLLDDWLQEAHKGKNGDGSSPKEGDESVEEFLLALLNALDKLPVNLHALQTCNIGKSVNHLRSYKNSEIQKKARSLVDAWKKRVDAEMTKLEMAKLNDAKYAGSNQAGSWPSKTGFSGVSCGGNKRAAPSEVAVKNAVAQPSTMKSLPVKIGHGDSIMKLNPATSGSLKLPSTLSASLGVGTKEPQTKAGGSNGTTELPVVTIKEEKINGSNQSQSNSQSCSNDQAKTVGSSLKEDARSSTSGSMTARKTSSGSSRHRKSSNSSPGNGVTGVQKDTGPGKSSSQNRGTTFEKASQSNERTVDLPIAEHGSHRLIVRFPNPVRSPARSVTGGSPEETSAMGSRASFPGTSEKNEHADRKVKVKTDPCRANVAADVKIELWQNDDGECVVGSVDGERSPTELVDEEHCKGTDETGITIDESKATSSSAEKGAFLAEAKSGRSFKASLSSINALIESCIKDSEASASVSGGDDLGMNLLASVAAGEISRSNLASPTGSQAENLPTAGDPCTADEIKPKFLSDDIVTQSPRRTKDSAEVDSENHGSNAPLKVRGEVRQNDANDSTDSFANSKSDEHLQENKPIGEQKELCPVCAPVSCNAEPSSKSESKSNDAAADVHVPFLSSPADIEEDQSEDCLFNQLKGKRKTGGSATDGLLERKRKARSLSSDANESIDCVCQKTAEGNVPLGCGSLIDCSVSNSRKQEKPSVEESSCPSAKENAADGLHDVISAEKLPTAIIICPESAIRNVDNAMVTSGSDASPVIVEESKKEKSSILRENSELESGDLGKDHINPTGAFLVDKIGSSMLFSSNGTMENLDKKGIAALSSCHEVPPNAATCESDQFGKPTSCSHEAEAEADKLAKVECSPEASSAPISFVCAISPKLNLDLNEGFTGDEVNIAAPIISTVPGCSSALHLPNVSHFTVSPKLSSSPASVTVAAPAKGPFVPPETLLQSKGEPGWKGSAATSAFRPAEPRRVLDMSLGTTEVQSSDSTSDKQCRLPLDIDLNVADEIALEEIASDRPPFKEKFPQLDVLSNHDASMRSSGRLDLDLNRVDEGTENGEMPANIIWRPEVSLLPTRSSTGGFPNEEASVSRDFDLNNGPSLDDGGMEHISRGQFTKSSTIPFLSSLRMNNSELGNISSWFPPGNSYPAVAIPSFLPDRGNQPFPIVAAPGAQRILGPGTGSGSFGSDLYRGPVLSSSPAMAFTPAAAFSYAGFPFSSSFPLASTSFSGGSMTYVDSASGGPCFPAVPPPLLGSTGAASAPCVRPYLINLPEGGVSAGSVNVRKWGWQGLDLNAGPGTVIVEGRDERLPLTSRQLSEEQARLYQAAGGVLKRKEPEGGWDAERPIYKQPSWQ